VYHDIEVQQSVENYQLGSLRLPTLGRSGELLGHGVGSSLEFQEYRQYIPGDDIRHLDWSAYARTDQLMIRLYREEISPRLQILVDGSRSMTSGTGRKPRVARQLAALFALLSGRIGGQPQIVPVEDDVPQPFGLEGISRLESLAFTGRGTLANTLQTNRLVLQKRSVRIVISDFLFPHDPEQMIRQLAADASALWVVQVLAEWESDPTPTGGRRLIDAETDQQSDLVLDQRTIASYRQRLEKLQEGLVIACRKSNARFAVVVADHGLPRLCREDLSLAGMVRAG